MGCARSKQEVQQPFQPTILTHIGSDQHGQQKQKQRKVGGDTYVGIYLGDYVWDKSSKGLIKDALSDLCASGCTEVIFQGTDISLDDDGNFKSLNRCGWDLVVANADGSMTYVGDQTHEFGAAVNHLKSGPITSITRVSLSICSLPKFAGAFESMARIKQKEGPSTFCMQGSQLWNAFEALFNAVPLLDAVVLDDESHHDSSILAEFSSMIARDFQRQAIPCPYMKPAYWKQMIDNTMHANQTIPMLHLQDYAGGGQLKNEDHISEWKFEVGGSLSPSPPLTIPVNPGFGIASKDKDDPTQKDPTQNYCKKPEDMYDKMRGWKKAANEANVPVTGAFIWEYQVVMGDYGTLRDWVAAIKAGMES